jgi:hypothetical protein
MADLPELKFDDELPELKFDDDTQPANDTKTFFDTGMRMDQKGIKDLAGKYGADTTALEKQAARYGATRKGATEGERATASMYKLADNALLNIPSWIAKKTQDDNTEKAIDDLREQFEKSKTPLQKGLDFTQTLATPMGVFGDAVKGATAAESAMKGGAVAGGVYGLGNSKSGNEGGAAVHGAGAGTIVAPLFQKALEAIARGGAGLLGRKSDVVDPYLENPEKYNDPNLTFENVQENIDKPLRKMIGDIGSTEQELTATKQLGREAVKDANTKADRARAEYIQNLRDTKVPDDAPDAVREALKQQRGHVNDLFDKQIEALEKSGKNVPIEALSEYLTNELEKRKVNGEFLPDDPDVAKIRQYQSALDTIRKPEASDLVDQFGNSLNTDAAPTVTEISPKSLRDLRAYVGRINDAAYNGKVGGHSPAGQAVGKQFNREINNILDTSLPNSTEAQMARQELAKQTRLNETASDEFGGEFIQGKLASLANANNRERLSILTQLDAGTGGKVLPKLKAYMDAQALLGNKVKLEDAIAKLPEILNARQVGANAEQATAAAAQKLNAAKAVHESVDGLTPDSSQAAIRRLLHTSNVKPEVRTREQLEKLGDLAGDDFVGRIGDLKVKNAFTGGNPNGSRLVQMGKGVGRAVAGEPGAAVGGVLGGAVDYSTGKLAKWGLDAYRLSAEPAAKAAGLAASKWASRLEGRTDARAKQAMALLEQATQRGPSAVLSTAAMLSQDPDFKE